MAIINPSDPERYIGPVVAVVTTPAEFALRNELRRLRWRVEARDPDALRPDERERIAEKLRAAYDAAFRFDEAVPDAAP